MQTGNTHSSGSGHRDGHKEEVQFCETEHADDRNANLGISSLPAIYMITCPKDISQANRDSGNNVIMWRFTSVSRENRCGDATAHCNSSTWEAETGGALKFLGWPDLHSKFQARGQGYTLRPLQKTNKKTLFSSLHLFYDKGKL